MTEDEHKQAVLEAQEAVLVAQDRLNAAVRAARADHITWAIIGSWYKVSRQAAWERFKKLEPHG